MLLEKAWQNMLLEKAWQNGTQSATGCDFVTLLCQENRNRYNKIHL